MSDHDAPISNFETNTSSFRRGGRDRADLPAGSEPKRRVMDIEDVLAWAYRDELPKGYRAGGPADNVGYPSMSPMFSMVAMGSRVDNWSREPGFPAAMGGPQPDALLVDAAVQRLAAFATQEIDDDLGLMPDLAAFEVDEAEAMRKALAKAVSLVVLVAKGGRRPFWTKETSYRGMYHDNGYPVVMAWQRLQSPKLGGGSASYEQLVPVKAYKNGTYPEGAHCVLTYTPDPKVIAEERAEYACWWACLDALAQELSSQLTSIRVLPPSAAQRPWSENRDRPKPPRVVPDLGTRTYQRQQRETAAAYRQLGNRRPVGARNAGAARLAPRRTCVAERLTG